MYNPKIETTFDIISNIIKKKYDIIKISKFDYGGDDDKSTQGKYCRIHFMDGSISDFDIQFDKIVWMDKIIENKIKPLLIFI